MLRGGWRALALFAATAAAANTTFPFSIQVGNPAYVLYPNVTGHPALPDMSVVTINVTTGPSSSVVRGYTCVGDHMSGTWLFVNGTSLSDVVPGGGFVNEEMTDAADIEGMIVDPTSNVVWGLMHREFGWVIGEEYYYNGVVMLVKSEDAGLSFTAVPNTSNANDSIVLQSIGPADPGQPANTGTGPHWTVLNEDDGFVYLFYQDAYAVSAEGNYTRAYAVARSPLAGGLGRGTWRKFYQGGWTGDGMTGNASALVNLPGAKIVRLNSTRMWLAVGYEGTLAVSQDLVTWTPVPSQLFPPLPSGQAHPVSFTFPNSYYYTSLVPGYGGTMLYEGDSLWLYYLFAPANNRSMTGNGSRALAAVELTLVPANASSPSAPFTVLSICQYTRKQLGGPIVDTWDTVWPVDQREYDYSWFLSFLFATEEDWPHSPLVALVDCVFLNTQDHITARIGECQPPNDVAYLGGLGYILADNSTAVPGYDFLPLWRCYDEANEDHYLAPLYGCKPTDSDPILLGYGLWQND